MTTYDIPSAGDLNLLRGKGQRFQIFGTFLKPDLLWQATLSGSYTRGDTTLTFIAGTGTLFSGIEADMPLYVGTALGSRDIGVLRIRSISSGDGGATGTITVARNALDLTAGYFLSFPNDHPFFPKYPLIIGDPENAEFRKDGDITYSNQNSALHPVVIAGSHQANFIDPILGYWEVESQLPDSYAMIPGGTITSYSAAAIPSTGVTININGSTGVGTIRFATPGKFWIKYTVTDSGGTSQSSYRFYYAHSTDVSSGHYPVTQFNINNAVGDWERGGWSADVTFDDYATLVNIPDRTLAIIWQQGFYDDTETNLSLVPDSNNSIITGYVRRDNITDVLATGVDITTLSIETIEAVMSNHYMFSVSLEAVNTTPSTWYQFRSELTNGRAVHHLWKWHSTLMEMTDVIGLTDNSDLRAFAEMEEGTVYSMADDMIRNNGIRNHAVTDKAGRIHITPDIQLLTDSERGALTEVFEIEHEDESAEVTIIRTPPYKTPLVRVSGFDWDGGFITTETDLCPYPPCPDVTALCASAPTTVPADEGSSIVNLDRQTFRDQAHANAIAGRVFAKENNEYPEVRVNFHGNYSGVLDVAYPFVWTMNINAADTVRGITWVDKPLICRNVTTNINVSGGIITTQAVFEPEMGGADGVATDCLSEIPDTEPTPDTPGDEAGGDVLVTGASVHVKFGDWILRTVQDVKDLIQDPFWQIKQGTTNVNACILNRCGLGYIKRSTDLGVTWDDVTPANDPGNVANDSPAPRNIDVEYFNISASQLYQDEFIYLARWQNNYGEWRSWLLYTDDDHVTYTWKSLTTNSAPGLLDSEDVATNGANNYSKIIPLNNDYYLIAGHDDGGVYYSFAKIVNNVITKISQDYFDDIWVNATFPKTYMMAAELVYSGVNTHRIVFAYHRDDNLFSPPVPSTSLYASYIDIDTGFETITPSGSEFAIKNISGAEVFEMKAAFLNVADRMLFVYTTAAETRLVSLLYNAGTVSLLEELQVEAAQLANLDLIYFNGGSNEAYAVRYKDLADGYPKFVTVNWPAKTKSAVVTLDTVTEAAPGSTYTTTNSGARSADASDQFVLTWRKDSDKSLVLHLVDAVNAINPTVLDTINIYTSGGVRGHAINRTGDDEFVLVVGAWDGIGFDDFSVATVSSSGSALTYNNDDVVIGDFSAIGVGVISLFQDGKVLIMNNITLHLVGLTILVTSRALWGGIGRGLGGVFYVTGWTPDELFIEPFLLPSLTSLGRTPLGLAVDIEVDTGARDVFVTTQYYDDDILWVFGNFSVGVNEHVEVAYSTDGGATFNVYRSGFKHTDALEVDLSGNVYTLRDIGYIQLYINSTLVGTVSTLVDTNPHGFKVEFDGTMYATSGVPSPIMVVKSVPPYTSWADLTRNHLTNEGIWAVEKP